jgi:predicted RNA-binding Zn ribbon-like protein
MPSTFGSRGIGLPEPPTRAGAEREPTLESRETRVLRVELLSFLRERLCLDFVNTVVRREGANRWDFLQDYSDLVVWATHVDLISTTESRRLQRVAAADPKAAARVFRRAVVLREAIARIFLAEARDRAPAAADLTRLQREYEHALRLSRLVPKNGRYQLKLNSRSTGDALVAEIARSAVAVLTSGEIARVKECAGGRDCGWLFLDSTKSGTRRWCRMSLCGSRAKSKRYYARRKRSGPSRRRS